jgi:hypothetical protein
MAQVARNLAVDGFLRKHRFLILDRDSKFTTQFRRILGDAGVEVVTTAFQAPNNIRDSTTSCSLRTLPSHRRSVMWSSTNDSAGSCSYRRVA